MLSNFFSIRYRELLYIIYASFFSIASLTNYLFLLFILNCVFSVSPLSCDTRRTIMSRFPQISTTCQSRYSLNMAEKVLNIEISSSHRRTLMSRFTLWPAYVNMRHGTFFSNSFTDERIFIHTMYIILTIYKENS